MASHHNTNIFAAEQTHGMRERALPRVPNCCPEKEKLHAVQLRVGKSRRSCKNTLVALLIFGCFAAPLTGCCNSHTFPILLSYHVLVADTFITRQNDNCLKDLPFFGTTGPQQASNIEEIHCHCV